MKSFSQIRGSKLRVILVGTILAAVGILLVYLAARNAGRPSPLDSPIAMPVSGSYSPLPTPNPVSRPETWSYYQLWFWGQPDESVSEYIRLLVSENLPYGRDRSWLAWVGHDRHTRAVLLAELQRLGGDTRPDVRVRVGETAATLGRVAPPVRNETINLLARMICLEEDPAVQRRLLRDVVYLPDIETETVHTIVECAATNPMDFEEAVLLGQLAPLSPETVDTVCQTWLNADSPHKLMDDELVDLCLTEEEAVQITPYLLIEYASMNSGSFESIVEVLASDGRFNDAIINTTLACWSTEADLFEYRVIFLLNHLGVQASAPVADRIAHVLMTRHTEQSLDTLGKLPLSPQTRTEVMMFLQDLAEDPTQSVYLRSRAAGQLCYLAADLDTETQIQALDTSLSLWDHPQALNPFTLSALSRLAPLIGSQAVQRSVDASLSAIHHRDFSSLARARAVESLPVLLSHADFSTTVYVVDDLLDDSGGDTTVRASAMEALATLAASVDRERQMRIAQVLVNAFHQGPIWYSDDRANCTLHISALEGLRTLAKSPVLASQARNLAVSTLIEALSESPSSDTCMRRFIAARALAEVSCSLDSTTVVSASTSLLTAMDDPEAEGHYLVESALARVEAVQVLNWGQELEPLLTRFRHATTDRQRNAYGAALFLAALCRSEYRGPIRDALVEIRETSIPSTALVAGQVITMIDSLDYVDDMDVQPLEIEERDSVSFAFRVAMISAGDDLLLSSFCPCGEGGN